VPPLSIPIAALTQRIEKELAWWRIEPKNFAAECFLLQRFDHGARFENRA